MSRLMELETHAKKNQDKQIEVAGAWAAAMEQTLSPIIAEMRDWGATLKLCRDKHAIFRAEYDSHISVSFSLLNAEISDTRKPVGQISIAQPVKLDDFSGAAIEFGSKVRVALSNLILAERYRYLDSMWTVRFDCASIEALPDRFRKALIEAKSEGRLNGMVPKG